MILDRIVAEKRREVSLLKRPRRSLAERLGEPGITVIAEIKRSSPSKGLIAESFDPAGQLEAYVRGGAGAVSVLTDEKFFRGSGSILRKLRPEAALPLLRKDFLIDPLQVDESFFLGADAVLLIAAILEDGILSRMLERVHSLGLEALVEVHDEKELHRVLETPSRIIGINNRNLMDFTVDLGTSERLVGEMERLDARSGRRVVAESGIASRADVVRLEAAGIDGILVGESLMRSSDPAALIGALRGI